LARSNVAASHPARSGITNKDYRIEGPEVQDHGAELAELIRRFLVRALPKGDHRIRQYGPLTSGSITRVDARVRQLD